MPQRLCDCFRTQLHWIGAKDDLPPQRDHADSVLWAGDEHRLDPWWVVLVADLDHDVRHIGA